MCIRDSAYGDVFVRNVQCSGVIPQISLIMGPCAGGAVYSPAMTDFIFMVKETSHMFITGPDVIKTVTGEEVTFDELGGADVHGGTSGVAHFVHDSEPECIHAIRELLGFLPLNNLEDPPARFRFALPRAGDRRTLLAHEAVAVLPPLGVRPRPDGERLITPDTSLVH